MPNELLIPEGNLLREPKDLLDWTTICRKGWEEYISKKRNGLTEHIKQQLAHELFAMEKIVQHLVPEEPVRIEDYAIVYDQAKIELNKIYQIEMHQKLYLVRKTEENVVETYELELVEE